jgi:hypothetical protein
MSDVNLNVVVQPVETNITINSNELSVTPTAIDLTLSTTNAGAANIVFDVQPATSNLVITTNDISFTPSAVNMQMYGALGLPGGNTTTVQFNNGGQLGGIPNVKWDGSNLSLGNIANVKLSGGSANYVIKTDGNGNLSWGTPTIAGANTTVQYNNNGQLGGSTSFTFNNTSNTMSVTNIKVGAYYYANGQPLNLSNTYSNANVAAFIANSGLITGVSGQGALLSTGTTYTFNGASTVGGPWNYYQVNDYNFNGSVISGFSTNNTYVFACANGTIVRSTDGQNWTSAYATNGGYISTAYNGSIIVAVGSNGNVAYSNNGGNSWSTSTAGATNLIHVTNFGSIFVAISATNLYTSTNGIGWTSRVALTNATFRDVAVTSSTVAATYATTTVPLFGSVYYSTNGTTYTNVGNTLGVNTAGNINSNTTTFCASLGGFTNYTSTNGSTWTLVTGTNPLVSGTTYLWNSGLGYWILPQATFSILTTNFSSYNTAMIGYFPTNATSLVEDFTVGSINLVRTTGITYRRIPQNLIYTNIATMSSAPTGNYICLGSVTGDFKNPMYTWVATT